MNTSGKYNQENLEGIIARKQDQEHQESHDKTLFDNDGLKVSRDVFGVNTSKYSNSGPLCGAGWVVLAARYSDCETACHKWEYPVWQCTEQWWLPARIVAVLLAGA